MGLAPDAVMRLTVREMAAFAKGHKRRSDMDYRLALWSAWHGALFARSKKLPDLDKLLRKISGRSQRVTMSTEQMLAKVEQLTALFGGVDLRKKKD